MPLLPLASQEHSVCQAPSPVNPESNPLSSCNPPDSHNITLGPTREPQTQSLTRPVVGI